MSELSDAVWIADAVAFLSIGAIGVAFCWACVKMGRWPWE